MSLVVAECVPEFDPPFTTSSFIAVPPVAGIVVGDEQS
jgi:hypothetical protein